MVLDGMTAAVAQVLTDVKRDRFRSVDVTSTSSQRLDCLARSLQAWVTLRSQVDLILHVSVVPV